MTGVQTCALPISPNLDPVHAYLFRLPHLPSVLVLVVALPSAPIHTQQVYYPKIILRLCGGDAESINSLMSLSEVSLAASAKLLSCRDRLAMLEWGE